MILQSPFPASCLSEQQATLSRHRDFASTTPFCNTNVFPEHPLIRLIIAALTNNQDDFVYASFPHQGKEWRTFVAGTFPIKLAQVIFRSIDRCSSSGYSSLPIHHLPLVMGNGMGSDVRLRVCSEITRCNLIWIIPAKGPCFPPCLPSIISLHVLQIHIDNASSGCRIPAASRPNPYHAE